MKLNSILSTALSLFCLASCQNIEGTEDPNPATYIRVYEGPYGYTASSIDATPDGYVVLGNATDELGNTSAVVFKVDKAGNRIGTTSYISGGSGNAIKTLPEGGYVIVGDSIRNEANPVDVNDFRIISTRVIFLSEDLTQIGKMVKSDLEHTNGKTDYRSTSIAVTEGGKLVILGTFQETDNDPIKPYLMTFDRVNGQFQESWFKKVDLLDQDYQNAKSVFYQNGKITWATAIANEQQNFNFSYVSIPTILDRSIFVNNSLMGASTEQLFIPSDIHPATGQAAGYGIVGTYGSTTKINKNMFFVRIDEYGAIVPGSERYFDAIGSEVDKSLSETEDTGEAISSTLDGGFVLAGSMTTIPDRIGAGARDIILTKVSPFGDLIWMQTIGGTGDEMVTAIRETEDGGILILGTNTVGGFPSIFLMKTNPQGQLN